MSDLTTCKLGEIATIIMGQSPKSETYNAISVGLPFLQGNRTFGDRFPNYDTYCSLPIKIAEVNDILFSVRAPVGDINVAQRKICIGRGLCAIRALDVLDYRYLYYLMISSKDKIVSQESGTVFGAVNKSILENIVVNLPSLSEQQEIAEILSSLDDKIELNNKINTELEKLAQTIYKQWFVDFEFPDENGNPYKSFGGELVDSELGMIPKGWDILRLKDVTEVITDGAHASPKDFDKGKPMASVKDMQTWSLDLDTCRTISGEDYNKLVKSGCKPIVGDILIAKDGSYLKHVFVVNKDIEVVLLSSIAILRPNNRTTSFFLSNTLKQSVVKSRLKDIVTGAVIQRIVLKDFRDFKIVGPSINIQSFYNELVLPMYEQIWSNIDEINTLVKTRDLLIKKLIK